MGALVRCTNALSGPTQPGGERQGKCDVGLIILQLLLTIYYRLVGVVSSTAISWPPPGKTRKVS